MNPVINNKEISVSGRLFRIAKLRHEWCDFLDEPTDAISEMRRGRPIADVFTFVRDIGAETKNCESREEA